MRRAIDGLATCPSNNLRRALQSFDGQARVGGERGTLSIETIHRRPADVITSMAAMGVSSVQRAGLRPTWPLISGMRTSVKMAARGRGAVVAGHRGFIFLFMYPRRRGSTGGSYCECGLATTWREC